MGKREESRKQKKGEVTTNEKRFSMLALIMRSYRVRVCVFVALVWLAHTSRHRELAAASADCAIEA